jgi:hypothetical protein
VSCSQYAHGQRTVSKCPTCDIGHTAQHLRWPGRQTGASQPPARCAPQLANTAPLSLTRTTSDGLCSITGQHRPRPARPGRARPLPARSQDQTNCVTWSYADTRPRRHEATGVHLSAGRRVMEGPVSVAGTVPNPVSWPSRNCSGNCRSGTLGRVPIAARPSGWSRPPEGQSSASAAAALWGAAAPLLWLALCPSAWAPGQRRSFPDVILTFARCIFAARRFPRRQGVGQL